ncbi:hypothetical protein KDA00_04265, partial [Candidatus Saccharibacteria bacterium]|nr:hypothetical protein [Candidatus Saccharibacteria bacterium]
YDPGRLWNWLFTFPDLETIINRGKLILTTKARLLLAIAYTGFLLPVFLGAYIIIGQDSYWGLLLILASFGISFVSILTVAIVGKFALDIKRKPLMDEAEKIFMNHSGVRIAVLGSYGKTTMKEILATVLGEKFKVAMTPGNKNVPISHARWSTNLEGDEDVLVIEYGEGEPGDIKKLARLSHPTMAVITGIAPNHLDKYKTIDSLASDFSDIQEYVDNKNIYTNYDAKKVIDKLKNKVKIFSESEVEGWKISNIKVGLNGTSFVMKKGAQQIKLHTSLLGEHNVSSLALAVVIATELGLSIDQIKTGVAKTKPFEHRMDPRSLNGAWLIDDTYNGNLEGFKAGLKLLSQLEAKRKIYVTPGLVDQGQETEHVHHEIGEAIANAKPNRVVLMKNENTIFIEEGLKSNNFSGEVIIEDDPLSFYKGLEQFVASGDVVLMQNDLPDAYN